MERFLINTMRVLFLYSFFFIFITGYSQKKIIHSIELDPKTDIVYFDLDKVFNINLKTTTSDIITINAFSEGEYANHFVVNEKNTGRQLNITGSIAFSFPNNQDKLSAHKVHAIDIEIEIPENLKVIIRSDIGNLKVAGNYKTFFGDLMSGNCYLEDIQGNITVQTIKGGINLITKEGTINAFSKYGVVNTSKMTSGKSIFLLKSLKGDINVKQSK